MRWMGDTEDAKQSPDRSEDLGAGAPRRVGVNGIGGWRGLRTTVRQRSG
jgi:hypothetical protein